MFGHASKVLCLAFAPGGERLFAGYADNTARLWDVKTKRLLRIFGGHGGPVRGIAISRDGRFAATAADDGAVRLWSLGEEATSVVCRDLDNNPIGRAFEGLDVAPDASAALSQRSEQGPQKLWDVRAGALVRTIEQGVPLFATEGRLLRLFRPPPEARRGGACSCRTAAASLSEATTTPSPYGTPTPANGFGGWAATPARSTASRPGPDGRHR